ncbi:hypothetical protein FQN57_003574 [Myotisia sp. PD_48]|nr:hypothetical protein FQN57_003574 [Myotisia sp. PD_48]
MKSTTSPQRRKEALPPLPPLPPLSPSRSAGDPVPRAGSVSSNASSATSHLAALNIPKRSLYSLNQPGHTSPRSPSAGTVSVNNSTTSLSSLLRPQKDPVLRKASPLSPLSDARGHRPRQHSQGFFEPSLPTASQGSNAPISASRIAAQAAMQHQYPPGQHTRNRSQTIPPGQDGAIANRHGMRDTPSPIPTTGQKPPIVAPTPQNYQNGVVGGRSLAAATAANIVFPRTPILPPIIPSKPIERPEPPPKQKSEKSKMKLFSKPKHIGISREKDSDKNKPMPSPNKLTRSGVHGLSRIVNPSTTSLNESAFANNGSMYSLANSSVATVVPAERPSFDRDKEKDKEKHKHHFLSRQKLKLKDKDDHFHLPLSSANSNSRPLDPNAPQSLYSFTPSSPSGPSFGKSMSGLDLRHGGRALREKKKEEKANAAAAAAAHDAMMREAEIHTERSGGVLGAGSSVTLGPSPIGSTAGILQGNDAAIREVLQQFGLQNMTAEDAWDFLKAKLIVLFEGEDIRIALEDLNKLVSIHLHRCIQKQNPSEILEDLRDFLKTGFASLNHSIRHIPDEALVPHLVNLWIFTFGTILPFLQAVFLPLDLEFKGRGSIMNLREAREFWGAPPNNKDPTASAGDELDVRNVVLISFRDAVILNRYELLKATFSRLSLEKINANINGPLSASIGSGKSGSRPSTSSAMHDHEYGSHNSQSSFLNASSSLSSDSAGVSLSRARAISNTSSNPEQYLYQSSFSSFSPPQASMISQHYAAKHAPMPIDPSHVTEIAGRMLQCICVLASVQTDDDAQKMVEELSKTLKHNWLGRGRTGRDRRGFVGTKIRPSPMRQENDERQRHSIDGVMRPMNGF